MWSFIFMHVNLWQTRFCFSSSLCNNMNTINLSHFTLQDYYDEVVLLLWSSSTVTLEYPRMYFNRVAVLVLIVTAEILQRSSDGTSVWVQVQ